MSNYKEKWDAILKKYFTGTIIHDDWLDTYDSIINQSKKNILDLGCGTCNNSLYLLNKGKPVISCDYSDQALKIATDYLPNAKTSKFDMMEGFPFENNFTDLILADLCLHYFSNEDTINILKEIRRVLTENGHLIFRVNSVNDMGYGALQGIELEKHYYEGQDMRKRFFNRDDLNAYFKEWNILDLSEEIMTRYGPPKTLWRGLVQNKKK